MNNLLVGIIRFMVDAFMLFIAVFLVIIGSILVFG